MRFSSMLLTLIVCAALVLTDGTGPYRHGADVMADTPKTAVAPSWPMFGGTPQRNLVNLVEKNTPTEWSVQEDGQKNIRWMVKLGNVSYGGPVIAGGKVFVGTNNENPRNPKIKGDKGVVMCFLESDGKFLWQAIHDKLASGQENDWDKQGIASTPAVDGNRVYYVNNRCELICADTEGFHDGKNDGVQDETNKGKTDADIVWRLDMIKELEVFPCFLANCSPLVVGDLVFAGTSNGVNDRQELPAPKAPSFVAVDKNTGKVVWKDSSPGMNIIEGQWSNPAYVEIDGKGQVIFPGGDGWVYTFEAKTGAPIWKFECDPVPPKAKKVDRNKRAYPMGTPVVHDRKLFVSVGQNPEHSMGPGHLWCIDLVKASQRKGDVSPSKDNFDPKAAGNENSALVWHYGGAIVPRPKDGREITFGRTLSTCAVCDDLLYITDLEGYLHCLDAKTGARQWMEDIKCEVWGSPLWVDGKVYLGTGDGDVLIFDHGRKFKLLNKVEMERPIKSPVVIVNGVLYVLTDSYLYAIGK